MCQQKGISLEIKASKNKQERKKSDPPSQERIESKES